LWKDLPFSERNKFYELDCEYSNQRKLISDEMENKALSIYSRIKDLDHMKESKEYSLESSSALTTIGKSQFNEKIEEVVYSLNLFSVLMNSQTMRRVFIFLMEKQ
jgi:hypothetical protein